MEPMVVMAARAAQLVGQELLKAHQNRHKLDLQVEEKGIDGHGENTTLRSTAF
jgi:myo-inositol-1(or 4)-monophosphatase